MIKNSYLFSTQFLNFLKSQKVKDEELFSGFVTTIKSIRSSIIENKTISDSNIIDILSYLQFAFPNQLESYGNNSKLKYAYLYEAFPLDRKVSCIYIIQPEENIDSTQKSFYPAFDLIHLLKIEKLEWGILTNGSKWRLYSTLSTLPYEHYVEIDFSDDDEEYIKVFWQLFSLNLFIPDENEVTQLEKYIEESEKEAKVIEDHIKNNIDDILENICFGFLSFAGKDNELLSEEEKQNYFDNAVYILFRLLFIFYAESRELLPIRKKEYKANSLNALLSNARGWINSGMLSPNSTELWDVFRDLCIHIEHGENTMGIPEYDGGLFDNRERPFLTDPKNKLTNAYFTKVLYNLGYYQKRNSEIKIEYRDLSVRSIGSLYEGILEYKLFIANEEIVIRGKKIIPADTAGKIKKKDKVIPKGNVYFSQDAFERHDTGSYYTPEDVVNYMVQNSVRLGLEERWIDFLPTVQKYEKEIIRALNDDSKQSILKKFDNELIYFINEKILTFKVMDPAMGSGHFLVNSLNAITHFIIEVLQSKVLISDGPIKHDKEIRTINWELFTGNNYDIDLNPVDWRRKVVERCIFGIDINPLSTELAKLSLWIASASNGKPLTFLNHHLKCGDSIMGVKLQDIMTYPSNTVEEKQLKFEGHIDQEMIEKIQEKIIHLLSISSEKVEDVYNKKEEYSEIKKDPYLNNLNNMATLWLMINFEVQKKGEVPLHLPDAEKYYKYLDNASKYLDNSEWNKYLGNSLVETITDFKLKKKVFHWELEFIELLEIRFDTVIGNPPYVEVSDNDYVGIPLIGLKTKNLYSYFTEINYNQVQDNGFLCMITPMALTSAKKMKPIKDLFLRHCLYLTNISDRPTQVFQDADISVNIFVLRRDSSNRTFLTNYLRFSKNERKHFFNTISYHKLENKEFILGYTIPRLSNKIEEDILTILFNSEKKIKDFLTDEDSYCNKLYYRRSGGRYYKLAFDKPQYINVNGQDVISDSIRYIKFQPEYSQYILISTFYTSLFYWFYSLYSDCYNFDPKDIYRIPLDLGYLNNYKEEYKTFYKQIEQDLDKNAEEVVFNKVKGITKYKMFRARKSKGIFDKIDEFTGEKLGFSKEMIEYFN